MSLYDLDALRDRTLVFRDRSHAGRVLGEMLQSFRGTDTRVLAVPAGGLPVASPLAALLGLGLDVAVVSKITLPWNTEVGYGAVAFDGTVRLNDRLISGLGMSDEEVRAGVEETSDKVRRRVLALRGSPDPPAVAGHDVLLVDDGLASGFTMLTAAEALANAGARSVVVAVPTGSTRAVESLREVVGTLYCANVRRGSTFAVADAYEHWTDVSENEASEILRRARGHESARAD